MKILYFKTQVGIGGLERITVDKMNYLVHNNNYEVAYAYFGNGTEKIPYGIDKQVQIYPMNIKACGGLYVKISSVWRTYKEVIRIIDDFKPDIIENADCVVVTWILPFIKKSIPKILENHQSYEGLIINDKNIYKNNILKIWINKWLRNHIYPLYTRHVVLTTSDKQAWGFKNTEVIGNFSCLKPNRCRYRDGEGGG